MAENAEIRPKYSRQQLTDIISTIGHNKILPAIISCMVFFALGGILSPGYTSITNLGNILASASILALAAAGQTLVILSGHDGIDLSIGEVMSLTAVTTYMVLNGNDSRIPLAILVAIALGTIIGFFNGIGIVFAGLPPLVMTLGMSAVVQGLVFASNAGGTPIGKASPLLLSIASGRLGPMRYLAIVGLLVIIIIELILSRTNYGKQLYLVGNNRSAARLCGIPINPLIIATYLVSGALSGIAGFFLLGYAGTANLDLGGSYTVLTIAAVVIGGTQLSGGEGGYLGTFIGSVLMVLLTTVLISVGVSAAVREILVGFFLMLTLFAYARAPKLRQ